MNDSDVRGRTGDPLARAGEGTTVRILERRCSRCGSRMEEICNGYTGELVAIRCRGGCTPAPKTIPIPVSATPRRCRSCGTTVYWVRTAAGKQMPVEADGVSHDARCKQAVAWRKRRKGKYS